MMAAYYGLALFLVVASSSVVAQLSTSDYDNCKTLGESRMQVAWTVNRSARIIEFLLCGCAQDETE